MSIAHGVLGMDIILRAINEKLIDDLLRYLKRKIISFDLEPL